MVVATISLLICTIYSCRFEIYMDKKENSVETASQCLLYFFFGIVQKLYYLMV